MKTIVRILSLSLGLVAVDPAMAQTATGVGIGTGVSSSRSNSAAVAVGGGLGQGGAGGSSASTVNLNAAPPAVQTINTNTSGTSTVKTVPSVFAPGLAAAGLETCLGSVSGGGSVVGTGLSFGTTIPDPGCAARLDARTLWAFGLKGAALARLCLTPDIYRSMPDICYRYMPRAGAPVAVETFRAAYASTGGGSIELIEGRTGLPRTCDDYDSVRKRCRAWAGAIPAVRHHKPAPTSVAAVPVPPEDPKPQ